MSGDVLASGAVIFSVHARLIEVVDKEGDDAVVHQYGEPIRVWEGWTANGHSPAPSRTPNGYLEDLQRCTDIARQGVDIPIVIGQFFNGAARPGVGQRPVVRAPVSAVKRRYPNFVRHPPPRS